MKSARGRAGYETRDVAARRVIYAGIALWVGLLASGGFVVGVLAVLAAPERSSKSALETTTQRPPAPRLEIDGRADRAALEAGAAAKLNGYAWVDRAAGTARIPIARAMALVAERGWGAP